MAPFFRTPADTQRMTDESDAHRIVSTAKLVVTFSAAIAATFVATALQAQDDPLWLDDLAALLMFVALACTIRVVMLPSHQKNANELKDQAHRWMVAQVWLASASSLTAAIALLASDWHWI
jgi:hypothetical protein